MNVTKKILGCIAAAALATAGCGDEEPTTPPVDNGFPQPAGTVALNFTIDASDRKDFYENEGLEWKGNFTFDKATRLLTYAADWAGGKGPYAPLYDDGPWDKGGHEPKGSVAGDEKFGITAFIQVPTEPLKLEYGAQIPVGTNCSNPDGCWIWKGSNGTVQLAAGSNAEVTAEGIKLDPEGTTDLRLTIDTNNLTNGHVLAQPVTVKGTFADWSKDPAFDDGTHGDATAGDKIYTYTLSANAVRRLKLSSGTNAEFIWMLGDVEYKNANSEGNSDGVKAYTKGTTGDFTERSIIVMDNKNTAVAIP